MKKPFKSFIPLACLLFPMTSLSKSSPVEDQLIENIVYTSQIIENQDIDESSGLALSRNYDNVLWTHNDSGDAAIIYALDFKGHDLGSYFLNGDYPRDWEDMSSFKLNGQSFLIMADTGDNLEMNLSAKLSIYKEPELFSSNSDTNHSLPEPEWIIEYQYPKGKSYDVESIAVDVTENKILLVSKRNKKVRVFELPLTANAKLETQVLTAKKIAKLDYLKKPSSMDITADGKYAVILSYGKIYWFNKNNSNSWQKTFEKPSKIIKYKGLFQPEAISFGKTAYQLFITSEKLPAKLLKIDF